MALCIKTICKIIARSFVNGISMNKVGIEIHLPQTLILNEATYQKCIVLQSK
jgi:hypothetical protein